MSRFERAVGNIICGILVTLVVISLLYNTFLLIFRDGVGASLSGVRVNTYIYAE